MYKSRALIAASLIVILVGCEDTETQFVEIQLPPPPPPQSTPLVVNVDASQLDGDFLLAGGAFSGSVYQSGDIYLRDDATGTPVELGNTYDQSYSAMIVDGTYESIYTHFTGGDVPANVDGVVTSGIAVTGAASLDIDVPLASVRPQFLLNGGAFPASVYNHATFYLEPVSGGERIFLGDSHVANDIVNVMPGDYHVVYSHQQGDQVPANQNARVMSNVAISGNAALVVDVTAVDARTIFTLEGNPFPQSQYISAEFYLVDDTGDAVFLANSFDAAGSIRVIAGTYNIEYRHKQGDSIPLNKRAVVVEGLDLSSAGVAAADVSVALLGIDATLNGATFPVSEYQDGILELYDPATDSYTLLGNTHNDFVHLRLIPGTYNVVYSHETGNGVPQNIRGTVLEGYNLAGDQQLALDVTGYTLTGSITLDAAAFPASQYNTADFLLRGAETTEDIFLFVSHAQDEPAMVLPGTYDVIYSCHNCIDIPFNSYAPILQGFEVASDDVVSTNLSSSRVEVSATLNGSAFDSSIYQSGLIWGGIGADDLVELTRTNVATPDIILLSGDYAFYYQHQNGDQVPVNTWSLVDQQSVDATPN